MIAMVTCPYCDNKFTKDLPESDWFPNPILVRCVERDNTQRLSCGKSFVIKVKVDVIVKSLKIEGEE